MRQATPEVQANLAFCPKDGLGGICRSNDFGNLLEMKHKDKQFSSLNMNCTQGNYSNSDLALKSKPTIVLGPRP
uniref:Uncharacterized protein n=1 Tax=Rhizophora mucronata TaxID=61149 RepID=A0A2P2QMR4_RHIMU